MIGNREQLTERGRIGVSQMNASIERAIALVDNVLDFARGRLGDGITLTRDAAQPLTPALEQVVREIEATAPDRAFLTNFTIAEPINCDRARVAQLLSNLVSNAVKHGAPGVPIEVEARTQAGRFFLSVSNGGVPIPPAARAQLFEPFFRGAANRSQQGLGLGLFIVNEIAKAQGGSMEVASTEECTRFTFSMPLIFS